MPFSYSVPFSFQIHSGIMGLMTNPGDMTENLAEDSMEKEFHVILRKEEQVV